MRHRPPALSQRISVPYRPAPTGLQGFPRPGAARTALLAIIEGEGAIRQTGCRHAEYRTGEVEERHARGEIRSLGSISSASANRPRIVTLADTSERSIDPTYRALRPARCASSSCVSCRSWRMRRRFAATISLRFMAQRNQIGTIIPGMIVPIRNHRCYFVGNHRFDSLERQSSGTWTTKSSTDGGAALRQQRP